MYTIHTVHIVHNTHNTHFIYHAIHTPHNTQYTIHAVHNIYIIHTYTYTTHRHIHTPTHVHSQDPTHNTLNIINIIITHNTHKNTQHTKTGAVGISTLTLTPSIIANPCIIFQVWFWSGIQAGFQSEDLRIFPHPQFCEETPQPLPKSFLRRIFSSTHNPKSPFQELKIIFFRIGSEVRVLGLTDRWIHAYTCQVLRSPVVVHMCTASGYESFQFNKI